MVCNGCGNQRALRTFSVKDFECCDRCGNVSLRGVPDVYFDGKPEHGLADDPRTGLPRTFSSKGEKAAYLKERGLQEAGDRIHGSTFGEHSQPDPQPQRMPAALALKRAMEMGADVRRQEYLRITKEGGRR